MTTFPRIALLACLVSALVPGAWGAPATASAPAHIRQLDLIHFSHTDYGFTDHPAVCRDMQVRYLDVALDTIAATRHLPEAARFKWTTETTVAVNDWWAAASPARRREFLRAVRAGQLEVAALPFNNTPFLSREQWEVMTHWLPEDLWREVRPRTAVQNDVNGFPRAGARALLDRGVRYLFAGINSDSGGPPLPRLSTFWWKQPDGRRLFVYLSLSYGDGFFLFEREEWRRGPVPLAADARYRPPRAGEILAADEAAVRRAHRRCLERLAEFEREGYRLPVLTVSMTSMWRYDNDPPFPPLSAFVAAWNRLGLEPRLRLATVSQAMADLEKAAGASAPEFAGEWTDFWANGTACAPREVAASRQAKRWLLEAQSPVWGPLSEPARRQINALTRDLCLFDEHTWGSSMSIGLPYSLDTQGQFNEKARLAWRPMALAEWLLSQRARARLVREGEGLWLANPTPAPWSGWASMITTCLRGDYRSVLDPATGQRWPIHFEPGMQPWGRPRSPADLSREDVSATFADQFPNRFARFWVENLPPHSVRRLQLSTNAVPEDPRAGEAKPRVSLDAQGWPAEAVWPGMSQPLFAAGLGDFVAVKVKGFAPRWLLGDVWAIEEPARREAKRREVFETVAGRPAGPAALEETAHTLRYTQSFEHPRLQWGTRRLELWKREPRARLTVRFFRRSAFDPELLGVVTPLPCDGVLPRLSSGGMGFTPFTEQLGGSCRDYFAVDGWAHYATPAGHWLWTTRDAPLMTLDGPHPRARLQGPPARTGRLVTIVYDNFWHTNFQADSPGVMEFVFDLAWRQALDGDAAAETLARGLMSEPVMVINPAPPENPAVLERLFTP